MKVTVKPAEFLPPDVKKRTANNGPEMISAPDDVKVNKLTIKKDYYRESSSFFKGIMTWMLLWIGGYYDLDDIVM